MGASKQFWRPEGNLNVPYRVFLKRFKYTEGLCIGIHIEFFLNYSIYIWFQKAYLNLHHLSVGCGWPWSSLSVAQHSGVSGCSIPQIYFRIYSFGGCCTHPEEKPGFILILNRNQVFISGTRFPEGASPKPRVQNKNLLFYRFMDH